MIQATIRILGVSKNSYFNYRKQDRPIMELLEKYFSKSELEEFLTTREIKKQELVKNLSLEELKNKLDINNNIDISSTSNKLYTLPLDAINIFYKIVKENNYLDKKAFLEKIDDNERLYKIVNYLFTDEDINNIIHNRHHYLGFILFLQKLKS